MSRRPWYLEFTSPFSSSSSSTRPSISQSRSTSTSASTNIISPSLTPPSWPHLRSLITPQPSVPPSLPSPWIWRCHHCRSIYRLGVTRRCLEDGHIFCSLPNTTLISPSSSSSTSSTSSDNNSSDWSTTSENEQRRSYKPKIVKKKRKIQLVSCASDFDYIGWEAYNTWRREMRILSQPITKQELQSLQSGRFDGQNRGLEKRSCEYDCNFPSECRQEREWERRLQEFTSEGDRDGEKFIPSLIPPEVETSPTSPPEQEIEEIEREFYRRCIAEYEPEPEPETAGQAVGSETSAGTDFEIPIGFSPTFGLGIESLDIDGLGERDAVAATAVREKRSSLEEESPGSPLKESFDFGSDLEQIWDAKEVKARTLV